jgi:putative oxidoreductase
LTSFADSRTDLALLLVRVVVGVTFLLHGLDKVGDIAGTEAFFDSLGIPLPAVMAPFVAWLEVIGGIALIVGALAPLFALALAGDMLVAGLTQHASKGFFAADGGYELVLLLGVASLAIVVAGAGRLSVDGTLRIPERVPAYPGRGRRPHLA